MKHIFLLLIIGSLLSSCAKYTNITVTAPTISSGVLEIKDANDSTIISENIQNGKVDISKKALQYSGYYALVITDKPQNGHKGRFDIYLEPGDYQITADDSAAKVYPKIVSQSKIQNELSAYQAIYKDKVTKAAAEYKRYDAMYKDAKQTAKLSADEYKQLVEHYTQATRNSSSDLLEKSAFSAFLKQSPESLAAAHIFAAMSYDADPKASLALFQQMSTAAQSTEEGKQASEKIQKLLKLIPGGAAPDIAGTTPDGKPFNKSGLNKKIYLIDFWKTGCEECRNNHAQLINILNQADQKNFGIISISLDKRREWWTSTIGEDHLSWPQFNDLKGNDSPNAEHWNITRIPRYCLVDQNWHMVENDISMGEILLTVNEYLKKH